jgi:hypothetical protein
MLDESRSETRRSLQQRSVFIALVLLAIVGLWPAQSQSLFYPAEYYAAGIEPRAVVNGDLNGDGILDLIAVNYLEDTIAVLLGVGNGTFLPPVFYGAGSGPKRAAVADLDGDQILDLAVTQGQMTGRVSVLLGVGDGSFAPRTSYLVGSGPTSVAIADLDGDLLPDLAVTNQGSHDVAVLLGTGDGTFGPASFYAAGSMPQDVAIGDVNGDDVPDLVTAAMNVDCVGVLLGNGDGTFGPPTLYAVGDQPWSVTLGDFNGDEALDIVAANPGYAGIDNIAVLLNLGNGSFDTADLYWVGDGPDELAVADLNLDGILDIVTANAFSNNVAVLLGDGNGHFGQPVHYYAGDGAHSVAVGDYDGDQVPDLAVADRDADCVAVLLGTTSPAGVEQTTPCGSRLIRIAPNPVRSRATLEFDLQMMAPVRLQINDVSGRMVYCAPGQPRPAGNQRIVLDLSEGRLRGIPSGTYFLSLTIAGRSNVRRVIVLR